MSMVLATTWVRRGAAAQFPTKYDIDEAELGRISKLARLQLEDAQGALKEGHETSSDGISGDEARPNGPAASDGNNVNDLKEYNLDDYDEEPVDEEGEKCAMFGNVRSLAYHAPNEQDPYLVLPEGGKEDDEERDELQILASDNLILAAKVEDEVAHLEVYVYEDESDNLYVHHDIMLPAIPLCVEWIDTPVGKAAVGKTQGSFVAVGTMSPEIEIWDLDVVDSMYPDAILGQEPEDGSGVQGKKKNSKKKPKTNETHHVDAVLALAANRQHRHLLASASADKTVKLWDLNITTCAQSYTMHQGKVCALDWHPTEATVLLSGSYDRAVIATDMRAPEAQAPRWTVEADVERVRWNPHDPRYFYVTTEAGTVQYFDSRNPPSHGGPSKPTWTLHAHDGAVSAFDINSNVPDFLATGSNDRRVKLWDVSNTNPNMIVSRNLDVGRIFSAQFAPDTEVGFNLSVAGSRGALQVWDTSTNAAVRRTFSDRVKLPETAPKERLVKLDEDSSDPDEDDEGQVEDGEEGERRVTRPAPPDGDGWEFMEEE